MTVGSGIAPDLLTLEISQALADYTAGGEFHPAPKNTVLMHHQLRADKRKCGGFLPSSDLHLRNGALHGGKAFGVGRMRAQQ